MSDNHSENDSELTQIGAVIRALESLDDEAKIRILRYACDKLHIPASFGTSPHDKRASVDSLSSTQDDLTHAPSAPDFSDVSNLPFPDFIHKFFTYDRFKEFGRKEQILTIVKYLCHRSNSGASVSDIADASKDLGYLQPKHISIYLNRLKKDDAYIRNSEGGWHLTMSGEERIQTLMNPGTENIGASKKSKSKRKKSTKRKSSVRSSDVD